MSRILFLNPPLTYKELYEDLAEGGSELPPLGLATLAAVARENGYEAVIYDAMVEPGSYERHVEHILKHKPDVLGVTATTLAIFNAEKICLMLRDKGFSGPIILGGPHFSAAPKETLERMPIFDVGVFGEGEMTILELLKALEGRHPLRDVAGILHRENGEVHRTALRPYIKELDTIPMPAWDLLPNLVKHYQPAVDSLYRFPASSLVTSRGCPGQCVFCDRSVYGNRTRGFSAEYVAEMMRTLRYKYGIKDLFIHDDNFVVLRKRLRELCEIIIRDKIDITWSCLGRVDSLDLTLLDLMKQAGCWQINFGLESGSQEILDIMAKQIDIKEAEEIIRTIRNKGIMVKGLFILGSFGETHETIQQTFDFIKRCKIDDFHMTCFNPFPGTEAYELAPQYGQFNPDWRKMNMFTPDNFVPNGLTREEILYYYRLAYRTFYVRPHIIWYYLKKCRDPKMAWKIFRSGFAFLKFLMKHE